MIDKIKNIKIEDKTAIKIILFAIFISMLALNFLTPLIADDYSYALTYDHTRIKNIIDIINYQSHHYMVWGGRSIAHGIAQIFLMFPKHIFSVFNSIIYIVVINLIYKIAKGKEKEDKPYLLLGIHFILYFLTPVFGQTCIWLIGSCNYIWTMAIILALIYQFTNNSDKKDSLIRIILMLLLGVLAGWTNENTSFGLIIILMSIIIINKINKEKLSKWKFSGLIGSIIGFATMILAPGNYVRSAEFVDNDFILVKWAKRFIDYTMNICNYCLPIIIILVVLITIYIYNHKKINAYVYAFILGSFFSVYSMLLSPSFPARSWFGVIVYLAIGALILAYNLDKINKVFKPILLDIIVITSFIFIGDYLKLAMDINQLRGTWSYRIEQIKTTKDSPIVFYEYITTNHKNPNYDLADVYPEVNVWPNTSIADYYGVGDQGIVRYVEEENEK